MDFAVGDELNILRKSIRGFAEDIVAPLVKVMEKTGRMPPELPGILADQGLYGVSVPFAYGGTGMTSLERLVALEEVARVSAACAVYLAGQHTAAAAVLEAGGSREKAELLPALIAGQGPAALALLPPPGAPGSPVIYRIMEDGSYRLDGSLAWCPGAPRAAWFLVEAVDVCENPALFILPHSLVGLEAGSTTPAAGLRGCPAGPLNLNAVWLPPDSRLAECRPCTAGDAITAVNALGFAAVALGIMQAALDAGLDFARKRVLYGKPIAGLQAVQFRLADMFADLEAGRLMAYRAAWLFDQNEATPLDLYSLHQFVASAAGRGTRKALEIFGGYGALQDFPVERYLRDAQALSAGGFPVRLPSAPPLQGYPDQGFVRAVAMPA